MGASASKTIPPDNEDLKALDPKEYEAYKKAFEKGGMSELKKKSDEDINHWKSVPVNIAVTGNSGVGKSSFINSYRGLKANSKGAADVDVDEMTKEPTKYIFPENKNIALWDLPGVGTTKFPRKTYLKDVRFKEYNFFLIITATRFTENDLWLANEVRSLGKKFYFIRTKMNFDVLNDKNDHQEVSKEQTVERIRSKMDSHLTNGGFPETRIFLIDNHHQLDYDFPSLVKIMIGEASKLKQEAMTFSMKTLTEDMIEKKKKALQRRIFIVAFRSAAGGAKPLPGVSLCVDIAIILGEVIIYRNQFGLGDKTLEHHAETLGVSSDLLKAKLNMRSHLIGATLRSVALYLPTLVVSDVADTFLALDLPIIGSAIRASIYYGSTVAVLRSILEVFVNDAVAINKALLNGLTNCQKDWDSHIKELKKRGADDACICSFDGNILAKSDGFNASQKELVTAIKAAIAKGKTIVGDDEKLEFERVPFMKMENLTGDHVGCTLISKPAGEKVLCCVACSKTSVLFVTKRGVVEICEDEVKYLKESGY